MTAEIDPRAVRRASKEAAAKADADEKATEREAKDLLDLYDLDGR